MITMATNPKAEIADSLASESERYPTPNRLVSGLVMGLVFLILFYVLSTIVSLIPGARQLWGAFLYFSSPLIWIFTVLGLLSPTRTDTNWLMTVAVIVPYPLAGFIVGMCWPTRFSPGTQFVRIVLIRFGWTLLAVAGFTTVVFVMMSGMKS